MLFMMQMDKAAYVCWVDKKTCKQIVSLYTALVFDINLRFASAVDKGTDWIVSSCPTNIKLSPVPRLDQTNEVCTLLLETQSNCNKYSN